MAQDRIEKIKLSIGKRAAAFSRAAALKLEIHRLRLDHGALEGENRRRVTNNPTPCFSWAAAADGMSGSFCAGIRLQK